MGGETCDDLTRNDPYARVMQFWCVQRHDTVCIAMTGTILCIATMYFVYTNIKTVKFSYKYVVHTFPHMVYIFYDMYNRGRKKCYVSCKQNDIKRMQ